MRIPATASMRRILTTVVHLGGALLLFFVLAPAFAFPAAKQEGDDSGRVVFFQDDCSPADLQQSIDRSIVFLGKIDQDRQFHLCGRTYSAALLRAGLELFSRKVVAEADPVKAQRFLLENFIVCRATGTDGAGTMLITGYYEPLLAGSLEKRPPYLYPLYRPPADLVTGRTANGEVAVGRMVGGKLLPYWSRAEIEGGRLPSGHEILYLADPLDAFILHVQGSGRVRLPDGNIRPVRYAANNGRPYRSIGRELVERGAMSLDEVTLPRIINYLRDHPEEREAVLQANARYIFFTLGEAATGDFGAGPVGSMGQPLTAGRSVALDPKCFPGPMIGFLETELPRFDDQGRLIGWRGVHRFVVNQDSGAAIRGPGRADFFFGHGRDAELAAGVMKQPGTLSFFLLRQEGDRARPTDK